MIFSHSGWYFKTCFKVSLDLEREVRNAIWNSLFFSFFAIVFACLNPSGVSFESFKPVKNLFLL
jgi:hypothetical protein